MEEDVDSVLDVRHTGAATAAPHDAHWVAFRPELGVHFNATSNSPSRSHSSSLLLGTLIYSLDLLDYHHGRCTTTRPTAASSA